MRLTGCAICLFIFFACGTSKPVAEKEKEEAIKSVQEERIVFVNLKITVDSVLKRNRIDVIDKTVATGHLKNNGGGAIRSNSYLTCIVYEDGQSNDTIMLQHPLYRVYEYMNEQQQLMLKETDEREATFSLRFQLRGKQAQLKILETIHGNSQKEIALIKLNH